MRVSSGDIRHCGKWKTWVGLIAFLLVGSQLGVEQLCNLPQPLPLPQPAPSFGSVLPAVINGDLGLDHLGQRPIMAFADAPSPHH